MGNQSSKEEFAKKVNENQIKEIYPDLVSELLHDQKGAAWLVSEQYLKERAKPTEAHRLRILAAKSLIENGFVDLTARQKQVILLAVEDLNEHDIAKFLNLSQPTVHEYLVAARKKLRKLIPEFQKGE